jgi:hypothetical protein
MAFAVKSAIDRPERTLGLVLAVTSYRNNPAVVDFRGSAVSRLIDPPPTSRPFTRNLGT